MRRIRFAVPEQCSLISNGKQFTQPPAEDRFKWICPENPRQVVRVRLV